MAVLQQATMKMFTAFVLVNVDLGKEEEVLAKLRKTEGVKEAKQLFGLYDIIVKIEAVSEEDLKVVLRERIRTLDRVRSTLTLMVTA